MGAQTLGVRYEFGGRCQRTRPPEIVSRSKLKQKPIPIPVALIINNRHLMFYVANKALLWGKFGAGRGENFHIFFKKKRKKKKVNFPGDANYTSQRARENRRSRCSATPIGQIGTPLLRSDRTFFLEIERKRRKTAPATWENRKQSF